MAITKKQRSDIEELVLKTMTALDKSGINTEYYKNLFAGLSDTQFENLIKKQFPPFSGDKEIYKSIILSAMHGAANAIEAYVEKNDPENEMEYQTTLTLAIMSKQCLFYGNAGDSGVIALDEQGKYQEILGHIFR